MLSLLVVTGLNAGAQETKKGCPELPTGPVPVYQRCQVDREAKLKGGLPKLAWKPSVIDLEAGNCIRAEFQFIVDTLGRPEESSIVTVNSTNQDFEDAARQSIYRLRYSPAKRDTAAVRQLVTYTQTAKLGRVMVRVTGPAGSAPNGGLPIPVSRPAC